MIVLRPSQAQRNVAAIAAVPTGKEAGTIPCPTCRKPLHYAFIEVGLKAHCETPGCTAVSE